MSDTAAVLIAIFSAGGAAFLSVLFKGFQLWRSGTQASEARAIMNLERYRKEADARAEREAARADNALQERDYWRGWAGTVEHVLRISLGAEAVPPMPAPPRPRPLPELEVSDDAGR